jgi:hypothetical protein
MGGEYFDQPLDVMNNPRIVNNVIDLGAFEKQTNLSVHNLSITIMITMVMAIRIIVCNLVQDLHFM